MRIRDNNRGVRTTVAICLMAATWVGGGSGTAWAADEPVLPENRFSLGVNIALVRFDSNFKLTDKGTGRDAYIDAEGSLGMSEKEILPVVFARYRFSKKHALAISAFGVSRKSEIQANNLGLGNYMISGEATLSDDTSFYHLNYVYTFMQDNRSRVFGTIGVYGLDLDYSLNLMGEIYYQGVLLESKSKTIKASVFAPLPMVGLDAVFALSSRWSLSTRVTLVGGSYQDISALVLDSAIRSKYSLGKHLALIVGIKYFNADITIDNSDTKTEVSYGFDGLTAGLAVSF